LKGLKPILPVVSVADKEAAKKKFLEFIESRNLRMTSQRQAIIDTVFGTDEHFTAEQLLEWSKEKDQSVSRATVYRTLPLLVESGFVQEMDLGRENKYYDPNYAEHPQHNHLICQDCDKIVEFEDEKLEELEEEISQRLGFSLKTQKLQISASCDQLKKLGACKNKAC
jgi:Fur family ferric uptake transcriptional regulator